MSSRFCPKCLVETPLSDWREAKVCPRCGHVVKITSFDVCNQFNPEGPWAGINKFKKKKGQKPV